MKVKIPFTKTIPELKDFLESFINADRNQVTPQYQVDAWHDFTKQGYEVDCHFERLSHVAENIDEDNYLLYVACYTLDKVGDNIETDVNDLLATFVYGPTNKTFEQLR